MCIVDHDDVRIRQWFNERKRIIQRISDGFKLRLVCIYSNLYDFYDYPYRDFSFYFACTYGSCALALQNLIKIYYQSSGVMLEDFNICSNHDAAYFDLFNLKELSTEQLTFYSTGIEVSRLEKIKYISKNTIVAQNLSVCSEEVSGTGHIRQGKINCGRCAKCLRTISELYVVDNLEAFDNVFELKEFKTHTQKELARMYCLNGKSFTNEIIYYLKKQNKINMMFYFWLGVYIPIWKIKDVMRNYRVIRKIFYKFNIDIKLNGYRHKGEFEYFKNSL